MYIGKRGALFGKAVHCRSLDTCGTVRLHIAVAEVIGQNYDYVGLLGLFGRGRGRRWQKHRSKHGSR